MTILAHCAGSIFPAMLLLVGLYVVGVVFVVLGLIRSSILALVIGIVIFSGIFYYMYWMGGSSGLFRIGGLMLIVLGMLTCINARLIPPGAKISKSNAGALGVLFLALGLFSTLIL